MLDDYSIITCEIILREGYNDIIDSDIDVLSDASFSLGLFKGSIH